ncbi:magnesium transporter CorA family protein [Lacrimispora algidixylanolytica]|uniref:Magnesium transporter n=1 Tax=Lacrimispora algidixylanolytica TaxID=94868 RepID=A0A419STE5_9FIRM|nr:magnesium transporter CorA family protein [Lacrimispora algidixylanolytica]RKD28543.1 magnesium transporter [Lacrimispora algidixylanolytica]
MLEILKTVNKKILLTNQFEEGSWVNLVNPSGAELDRVSSSLNVEMDFLKAALDEEERARIETLNDQTLITIDIPIVESVAGKVLYITIPLAIILKNHLIITVCLKDNILLNDFKNNRITTFCTQFKTRFVLQILLKNANCYLYYLRNIDKTSSDLEQHLYQSMKNNELIKMLQLEKSLVYFSTSLKSNEMVLEKLMKYEYVKYYPEDEELLEDVMIENKQAIEMAHIYSNVLSGTMGTVASLISNNLNIVMKVLTSITIVMAIPTMISSFFGMNVVMPLTLQYSFWIIVGFSVIISSIVGFVLYKKKLF